MSHILTLAISACRLFTIAARFAAAASGIIVSIHSFRSSSPRPLFFLSPTSTRCLRRSTNFSTTSDDTNSRPLPWFACNRLLEKGTLSFRLKDPAGGKTKCGTDVVRYVNGDGSSCRPVSALTASEHPCFGCNRTPDEVSLADSMGDDIPSFIFGENGFFKDRAERVGDVRDLLVANRAKARSQDVTSPKKPNT